MYGCLTCDVEAGLCAFCTLECHRDHEIFEVGPRSAFKCDCPTLAFPGECCSFKGQPKLEKNNCNVYNQNYRAIFCNCQKKILAEEEDMMQCPLCADYFHPQCQSIPVELVGPADQNEAIFNPEKDQPFRFCCKDCYNSRVGFLKYYPEIVMVGSKDLPAAEGEEKSDVPQPSLSRADLLDMFVSKFAVLKGYKPVKLQDIEQPAPLDAKQLHEDAALGKRPLEAEEEVPATESCTLVARRAIFSPAVESVEVLTGVFMRDDMYDYLCKCDSCLDRYAAADPQLGLLTDVYLEDKNFEEAVAQAEALPLEEPMPENDEGSDMEFMKYMAGRFKERTGREIGAHEQLVMSEHYSRLKEQLGHIIVNSGKTEITEQDMKHFLDLLRSQ